MTKDSSPSVSEMPEIPEAPEGEKGESILPQPSLIQEQELVQRILNGEKGCFRKLYQSYAPALMARLCGLIGDVSLAEDCLQQVFCEALRALSQYRGEGSLAAWLNQIATRIAFRLFRRQKRFSSLLEQVWPYAQMQQDSTPGVPQELLLRKETRQMVWQVLEQISAQKRMAVLLCDFEGATLEDAAAHLGISLGTLSSRLWHGRKEFRKKMLYQLKRQGLSIGDLL